MLNHRVSIIKHVHLCDCLFNNTHIIVHMKTNGLRRILRSMVTAGGRRCRFGRFLRATVFSSVRWVRAVIKSTIRFKN